VDLYPQLKKTLRNKLAIYPRIFIPAYRILAPKSKSSLLVSKDTEIVIEGFPRSGNTYAVAAFRHAQKKKVKTAHHLHVEAQILEGVRLGLPVVVLIRKPLDAIQSLKIRQPELSLDAAFRQYIRFYSITRGVLQHVLLAKFEDVIENYGKIIERVNHKFCTHFDLFEPTTANVASVVREIERINDELFEGRETHVSRPSPQRAQLKKKVPLDIPEALAEKANTLYGTVCFESELKENPR
jgi:hypothetical protein